MRTECLLSFKDTISDINRDITLALFINEQFALDNAQNVSDNPNSLVREFYSHNKYRYAFNYRLDNITELINEHLLFISRSSYVLIYTNFELYLRNMIKLIRDITKSKPIQGKLEIENVFLMNSSSIERNLSQEEINTLDYIRKRRNTIAHPNKKLPKELNDIITNEGANLNAYWMTQGVELKGLDFSSHHIDVLNETMVIDIIKLLRHLASLIDKKVLHLIDKHEIIDYLVKDFKEQFSHKVGVTPRTKLEKMFLNVAKRKIDIEAKDIDFTTITF